MTHPGPVVIPGSGVPEFAQEFDVEVARHQARLEADRAASHDGPLPHLGPSVCGVCSPYGGSDPVTPAEERTGEVQYAAEVTYLDGTVRHTPASDREHADLIVEGINVHVASLNEPTRRMLGVDNAAVVHRLPRPPWPWKPVSEPLSSPVTPAEERTGVSDRAAAALTDVAELRRETFRLWSAGTVGRHDGLARLDRIEAALRGEQR